MAICYPPALAILASSGFGKKSWNSCLKNRDLTLRGWFLIGALKGNGFITNCQISRFKIFICDIDQNRQF